MKKDIRIFMENNLTFIELSDTILTIFFTALLTFFSFVQWKAVEEQNKQSLFKLRMEHYTKFNAILIDLHSLTLNLAKSDDSKIVHDYKSKVYQLEKISLETEYLFSSEVFAIESKTVVKYVELLGYLKNNTQKEHDQTSASFYSLIRQLGLDYKNSIISYLNFK